MLSKNTNLKFQGIGGPTPILKFALEMILPMCAHCTQKRKIGNIYVKLGIIYDVGIMTVAQDIIKYNIDDS